MADSSEPGSPSSENIGEATYRAVNELTGRRSDPLTRAQAFAQLAAEQGRKEGTVSANYYRVARKRGEGRPATRPAAPRRATKQSAQAGSLLEAIERAKAALEAVEVVAREDLRVREQLRSLL